MAWNIVVDPTARLMRIEGELNIYSVSEIRERLLDFLTENEEVEVDLDAVTDIDTAGIQLMLLAKRFPNKLVRFVRHSAPVLRLVDLANIGQVLGDPLVLSDHQD